MRELKFRAWDKVTKRHYAVSGLEYDDDGELCEVYFAGIQISESNPDTNVREPSDVILEQYTGLKDKNGTEIYEGDILGGIWEGGFISWCEKCKQLQYRCAGIGCMACSGDVHWCEIVEDDGKLEVIGNIHENPELMEGSK